VAPPQLAPRLQSLPPILDNLPRTPTSSCSKGSRGLSVQPRVLGIFTETTISPDPSKRQRPSRYAIRAGRNFASILRYRRRRLSLHLDEASRVSLQRRTAGARWDSSPEQARRSSSGRVRSRCRASAINLQMAAKRSKSNRFPESSGYRSKCGTTRPRMSSSRRVSHFTVLSLRSGRMLPHPKYA
jgi:hypothetical protein